MKWEKIKELLVETDECIEWPGYKSYGYGRVYYRGRRIAVTRVIAGNGEPVPQHLHVLHLCDNPSCVNPRHLRAGTAKDNAIDRTAKGRTKGSLSMGNVIKKRGLGGDT